MESPKPEDPNTSISNKENPVIKKGKNKWLTNFLHFKTKALNLVSRNWINFFLMLFTGALVIVAILQYMQYKIANEIALDNFKRANAAIINLEWTFVWRHGYRNTAYWGPRRTNLQFNLWNYSDNTVEVRYFKYKIYFNYDDSIMNAAFSKNFRLTDSINIENKQGYHLSKSGYVKLIIPSENLSVQDSANLAKNLNMVFLEVHYYNIKTKEKLKYQFKGVVNGENKKDSTGEYLDKMQEWENIKGSTPDLPDN